MYTFRSTPKICKADLGQGRVSKEVLGQLSPNQRHLSNRAGTKTVFLARSNQEIQTKTRHRKRYKKASQRKKIYENSKVFLSIGTTGVCFSLLHLSEFSKISAVILNVGGNLINFIFKITYNIKALETAIYK